jgi:hypothetical protein
MAERFFQEGNEVGEKIRFFHPRSKGRKPFTTKTPRHQELRLDGV